MKVEDERLYSYLTHIQDAIARIQRYTNGIDETRFLNEELIQDAVIRNLEIIGEASRNIEKRFPDFAASHTDLPFTFAWEMRNALSHGYFQVDLEIVWRTIERDLPFLHEQVEAVLSALDD